jgi:hypothetical protein
MGLGKTAQTICFLGLLQHAALEQWRQQQQQQQQASVWSRQKLAAPKPHFIVCPSSLLENWQRELKLWCPKLRCVCLFVCMCACPSSTCISAIAIAIDCQHIFRVAFGTHSISYLFLLNEVRFCHTALKKNTHCIFTDGVT